MGLPLGRLDLPAHALLARGLLLCLQLHQPGALGPEALVQPHPLDLVALELGTHGRQAGLHLRQPGRQPLDLRRGVRRLALGVGCRALGVAFQSTRLELLGTGPLCRRSRGRELGFRGGQGAERALQPRRRRRPTRLRLPQLLRERLELGAPLERAARGGAGEEHRAVRAAQRPPTVEHFVAREQGAHPRCRRPVHAQLVGEGVPVGRAAGTGCAGQQHERTGPGPLVPLAHRLHGGVVAYQNRVQPLPEQLLGELGVTSIGAHKIRQWTQHDVTELRLVPQQGLGARSEANPLPLELGERVPPRGHLRERFFRLALRGAVVRLLLLQLGHAAPRSLQALRRLRRRLRLRRGLPRPRRHLGGGGPLRLRAGGALAGCLGELLAQLPPLSLERGALAVERPGRLGATLQILLELAHRRALRLQPVTAFLLERAAAFQLALHRGQIALGGSAFRCRGDPLALRLGRPRFLLLAVQFGRGTPLARVAQPFGGQGEIALEPPDFELRVAQTPLLLGAARFRGMSRLNPRLSLALGVRQPRALRRQ